MGLDGSNKRKINITLPPNMEMEWEEMARVTADGQKIILLLSHITTYQKFLYKCNIDGSNLALIIEENMDEELAIQDVY